MMRLLLALLLVPTLATAKLCVTTTSTSTTTVPCTACPTTTSTSSTSSTTSTTGTTLAPLDSNIFWIDSVNGVDTPLCGQNIASACRTYYYFLNTGCGGGGCKNAGIPHTGMGGDVVHFRTGTYHGDDNPTVASRTYIAIPWNGTSSDPVTYDCYDGAGLCINDLGGVTGLGGGTGMFAIGAAINVKTNASDPATYITLRGFTCAPGSGTGVRSCVVDIGNAGTHHILLDQMAVDPATLANFLGYTFRFNQTAQFTTIKRSKAYAARVANKGGPSFDRTPNIALIANELGVANDGTNNDCHNLLGTVVGLSDGNSCHDNGDGMDSGENDDVPVLDRLIIRYNDIHDINGDSLGSRCVPMSGNSAPTALIGQNAIYKNLCYQTRSITNQLGIVNYGGAQKTSIWYNTAFLAGADEVRLYTQGATNPVNQLQTVNYNILSTIASSGDLTSLLFGSGGITACPTGLFCPYTGNDLYSPEHGSTRCVDWQPSDAAFTTYTCAQVATTFNTINGNAGNQNTNPVWVNRSATGFSSPSDLALQPTSPLIDEGQPFCRAVGSGSTASTITVTCLGATNDPRYFFPDPTDYYGVDNSDCVGQGARAFDGAAATAGCFDIQIDGCGIVTVTGETSSTISFTPACSWSDNAMVHVPWNGAGPDLGALEAAFDPSSTTTSTVTTTSTSSSTSTSTTSTTGTTTTTTTIAPSVQVLSMGATTTAQSTGAINYAPISGMGTTGNWQATESLVEGAVAQSGTFGGLRAVVETVPGGTASWTVTLDVNGTPSALTCTITSAATTCQDATHGHNVSVVAGDRVAIRSEPTNTPAAASLRVSVLYQTVVNQTLWPISVLGTLASANGFLAPLSGANGNTDSAATRLVVPIAGTVENLTTVCANAVGAGATRVFTVNLNGVGQTLTCTQSAGQTLCSDTGHPVSVVAGDQVNLAYTFTGTPGSSACALGLAFSPTTTGLYVLGALGTTQTTPTTATDLFAPLSSQQWALSATDGVLARRITQASTVKNIYVLLDGTTGTSSTLAVTLNDGGVATAESCSMTNGSTCNLTADASVADDDLLDTVFHHTGSAGQTRRANVSYSAQFTGSFP